jgi:adenylate kinase
MTAKAYKHIIMVGPPGSGKGTQAAILAEKLQITTISAGELLRAEARTGSELGKQIAARIDFGKMVPPEIIVRAMLQEISKPENSAGYIMDGFPRSMEQVGLFDEAISKEPYSLQNLQPDLVLLLQVPDEYIYDRILGRSQCKNCGEMYHEKFKTPKVFGVCDRCGAKEFTKRADDTYETVVSRLCTYRSVTAPIIPYYEEKGLLKCIDGTGPISVVSEKIRKVVGY